jgi:hypothetical protein
MNQVEKYLYIKERKKDRPIVFIKGHLYIMHTKSVKNLYEYTIYSSKNPIYFIRSSSSIETLKKTIDNILKIEMKEQEEKKKQKRKNS